MAAKQLGVGRETLRRCEQDGKIDPPGEQRRYDLGKSRTLASHKAPALRKTVLQTSLRPPPGRGPRAPGGSFEIVPRRRLARPWWPTQRFGRSPAVMSRHRRGQAACRGGLGRPTPDPNSSCERHVIIARHLIEPQSHDAPSAPSAPSAPDHAHRFPLRSCRELSPNATKTRDNPAGRVDAVAGGVQRSSGPLGFTVEASAGQLPVVGRPDARVATADRPSRGTNRYRGR